MVGGAIVITEVRPLDSALVIASSPLDGSTPILTIRAKVVDNDDDNKIEVVRFIVSYDGGTAQTFPVTTETDDGYYMCEISNPDNGGYCYHIEAVDENNQVIQFPNDGGQICFELSGTW